MSAHLYEDPQFQSLMESMRDDNSISGIVADYIEESRWGHLHAEYVNHLRAAGNPVPKELEGYDWQEAFGYSGERETHNQGVPKATPPNSTVPAYPFTRREVRRIIAMQDGENDGPDWVVVGELWDGRFFAVRGGCDYTGWD